VGVGRESASKSACISASVCAGLVRVSEISDRTSWRKRSFNRWTADFNVLGVVPRVAEGCRELRLVAVIGIAGEPGFNMFEVWGEASLTPFGFQFGESSIEKRHGPELIEMKIGGKGARIRQRQAWGRLGAFMNGDMLCVSATAW
jgi:hypothetical protein